MVLTFEFIITNYYFFALAISWPQGRNLFILTKSEKLVTLICSTPGQRPFQPIQILGFDKADRCFTPGQEPFQPIQILKSDQAGVLYPGAGALKVTRKVTFFLWLCDQKNPNLIRICSRQTQTCPVVEYFSPKNLKFRLTKKQKVTCFGSGKLSPQRVLFFTPIAGNVHDWPKNRKWPISGLGNSPPKGCYFLHP